MVCPDTAANGLPDAQGNILIMQLTTSGQDLGRGECTNVPFGVGSNQEQVTFHFDGVGVFGAENQLLGCGALMWPLAIMTLWRCTTMVHVIWRMRTLTAFVMRQTLVLVLWTIVVCATVATCLAQGVLCHGHATTTPDVAVNDFDQCDFESCKGCMDETATTNRPRPSKMFASMWFPELVIVKATEWTPTTMEFATMWTIASESMMLAGCAMGRAF